MVWRKWLVRSLVFTVAGSVVVAAFAYQHWTNPAIVRRQVLATLEELLPQARVSLESARLRLLGGISFEELRLERRDDPSRKDFIYVPSGILYHDKEQLLSGKLAIARIVWYRPILHVIRSPEGKWNMADVLAPPTPQIAIPTIRLQHATLLVEDHQACPDASPVEIRDVNLVIMNDPHQPPTVSQLIFNGTGVADLTGTVHIEGTRSRLSGECTALIDVPRFSIQGSLVQRLSKFYPEAAVHIRELTGIGKLQAKIHYHPEVDPLWHHDVRWQLTQGQFHHAQLPFPLHNLEAKVRCVDGQITLEKLTAQSGSAQFQLSGKALALDPDTDILDGRLKVDHLCATKELFEALPSQLSELREVEHDYAPQGTFSLDIGFSRRAGQWRQECTVTLEQVTGVCAKFPYRLNNIAGTIEKKRDGLTVSLVGYAGSQPVLIQGEIHGEKPAAVNLRIRAKDVLIDDTLYAALQPEFYEKVVRPFHAKGYVDIEADVRRAQGECRFANHYVLHFHDAAILHDVFPYPLERVSGTVTIEPDRWEYHGFRGTHKGGEFQSQGKPVRTPQGNRVKIEIAGTNVLLDGELRAALKRPALETAWKKLDPGGRMRFEAQVDLVDGQEDPELDVIVTPTACTIQPEFFPYALSEVRGTAHYAKHQVKLHNLSARHEQTQLTLAEGDIVFNADGSFSVALSDLVGNPLIPDAAFVRALPPVLGKACTSLALRELLSLKVLKMTIAVPAGQDLPPQIQWDGGVRLKDATLRAGVPFERVNGVIWCSGEHHGTMGNVQGNLQLTEATLFQQGLRDIHGQILVDARQPDSLLVSNLKAKLYGGDVVGSVRVDFAPSVRYEADLKALQIQLEELSRAHRLGSNAQQSGMLDAQLYLQGQGTEFTGLKGYGSIDVPSGKMYNLPLLLDLLKFLSLRFPDGTFIEEAHARFRLDGPRVEISRIDLLGAAISLGGCGTVNLESSTYNMDLYAVWGRIVQLSPPVIREVWPTLSKELLKIKMKGKIGEKPQFKEELAPGLLEPLEKMRDRMAGRQQ